MTTPDPIHCPFVVLIDTSEQHPWTFRGLSANADKGSRPLVIDCKPSNMMTGDYTIEGFENRITIERKSLSDAFSTFTHDRERWLRELERMRSIESCHVVIEAGFDAIIEGPSGNGLVGKSVIRSIMAWSVRYPNVHWWPMPSRDMAEATAFRILEKFWEEDQWQAKELAKLSIESESRRKPRRSPEKCTSGTSSLFPQ